MVSNTNAFCCVIFRFLSNSGKRIFCIVTTWVDLTDPANVLRDFVSAHSFGTIPFGNADLLIKHWLDPESSNDLSNLLLLTDPMEFTMHKVVEHSFFVSPLDDF